MFRNIHVPFHLNGTNSAYWFMLRTYLRLMIKAGSLVVIVGPNGSGRRELMEKLTRNRVLDDSKRLFSTGADRFIPSVGRKYPCLNQANLPESCFAVDNAAFHDSRSLAGLIKEVRGLVLGFQLDSQVAGVIGSAINRRRVVRVRLSQMKPA